MCDCIVPYFYFNLILFQATGRLGIVWVAAFVNKVCCAFLLPTKTSENLSATKSIAHGIVLII